MNINGKKNIYFKVCYCMTSSLAWISNRLMSMEHLMNSTDEVITEVVKKR